MAATQKELDGGRKNVGYSRFKFDFVDLKSDFLIFLIILGNHFLLMESDYVFLPPNIRKLKKHCF